MSVELEPPTGAGLAQLGKRSSVINQRDTWIRVGPCRCLRYNPIVMVSNLPTLREGPNNWKEYFELYYGYFGTNLLANPTNPTNIRTALMLSMVAFMMSEMYPSPAALGPTMGLVGFPEGLYPTRSQIYV